MKNANKLLLAFLTIVFSLLFFDASNVSALYENSSSSSSSTLKKESSPNSKSSSAFSLSSFKCGEPLISKELHTDIDKFKEEDANMVESFIATQSQHFLKLGDINGLGTLVFGNPYCSWVDDKNVKMSSNGVFTEPEMKNIINPIMDIFKGVAISIIVISILISALKLMTSPMRGAAMDDFFSSMKMILFVMILYVSYDILINLIFQINAAIVLSIKSLMPNTDFSSISIVASWDDLSVALGFAPVMILVMVEWVLSVIVNFIYISRKVIILVLMAIGFIAIYSLLFNKTRGFFVTWLRELCGNIFLQSIHAIVLYSIVQFSATGAGTFFKICLLVMFIPISGLLSKLLQFGDSATKTGMTMSMLGLGGIASTYLVASQAGNILRGGGMMSNSSSTVNADGSVGGSSLASLANSSGSSLMQTALSSSATGVNSPAFSAVKNAMATAGSAAGSVAGMVAGPLGVGIGAGVGRAVGGGIPQIGMNIGTGIAGLTSTLSEAKQFAAQSGVGLGSLLSGKAGSDFAVAAQGRHFAGGIGESIGLMIGGQKGAALGRSLASNFSMNSDKLAAMNSSSLGLVDSSGNTLPMSYGALSNLNPGGEMKFVQTNQGSAMYMNGANGWQQVGLTGAADTSLANGQARVMDYNLADLSKEYQLQPNGSYTTMSSNPVASANSSLTEALGSSVVTSSETTGTSMLTTPIGNVATSSDGEVGLSLMNNSGLEGATVTSANALAVGDVSSIDTGSIATTNVEGTSPVFTSTEPDFERVNDLDGVTMISQPSMDISSLPATTSVEAIPEAPSNNSSNSESTFERPELAGLPGSTDYLMRTSDAVIVNTGGVSFQETINEVTKSDVVGFKDDSFDPKKFNPDTYIYRGPQSHSYNVEEFKPKPESKETSSWIKQAHRVLGNRHKGVS